MIFNFKANVSEQTAIIILIVVLVILAIVIAGNQVLNFKSMLG